MWRLRIKIGTKPNWWCVRGGSVIGDSDSEVRRLALSFQFTWPEIIYAENVSMAARLYQCLIKDQNIAQAHRQPSSDNNNNSRAWHWGCGRPADRPSRIRSPIPRVVVLYSLASGAARRPSGYMPILLFHHFSAVVRYDCWFISGQWTQQRWLRWPSVLVDFDGVGFPFMGRELMGRCSVILV